MRVILDQNYHAVVILNTATTNVADEVLLVEGEVASDIVTDTSYSGEMGMGESVATDMGQTVKDPLLSNWFAVIGISVAALALGSVIGVLLALKKIKKGIDPYED